MVNFDDLKTRLEFEKSQKTLETYKLLQGIDEKSPDPIADLLFVDLYNEHVSTGSFESMREVKIFILLDKTASSNKLINVALRLNKGYRLYGCAEHHDSPFKLQVGTKSGGDATTVVKQIATSHKGRRKET